MVTIYVLGGIFSYLSIGGFVSGKIYKRNKWNLEETPAIMGITLFWPVLWTFYLGIKEESNLPEAKLLKDGK